MTAYFNIGINYSEFLQIKKGKKRSSLPKKLYEFVYR